MAFENPYKRFGVVILAAGESSRLGSPKQLLPYLDSTLLQHAVEVAQTSKADSVIIVLGANADLINKSLKLEKACVAINSNWNEGMASTIRCGLKALIEINPQVDAAIFMVGDQPFVTTALLNSLGELHAREQRNIVACEYGNTYGTPVLFNKRFFTELMELTGDSGAKSLIRKYLKVSTFVSFPKGNIDIDTIDDYKILSEQRMDQHGNS